MGALNQDFKYPNSFRLFIGLVLVLFLTVFAYSIALVIGVFDMEMFSPTVAGIGPIDNYWGIKNQKKCEVEYFAFFVHSYNEILVC